MTNNMTCLKNFLLHKTTDNEIYNVYDFLTTMNIYLIIQQTFEYNDQQRYK